MNRLMRAEFFRFLHSGVIFRILLLCCLGLFVFPMAQDTEFLQLNLTENLGNISAGFMMFTMFLPLVVTIAVANNYAKKTAYYEVMAGNRIGNIIGSKLAIEGVLVAVIVFVAMSGMGVLVALKNGVGEVNQLGSRGLLLIVLCMHVTFVSALIGMAMKSIVGAMVSYLRFTMLELVIEMVLPLLEIKKVVNTDVCRYIRNTFLMNQIVSVFGSEINVKLVGWVLGSFLVEVALWYGIVWYTMKKRLYK